MKLYPLFAVLSLIAGVSRLAADTPSFKIHGKGWVDAGRIMRSPDSMQILDNGTPKIVDLNGSWLQSLGAQVTVTSELGENWEGALGFGAYQATNSIGTVNNSQASSFLAISLFKSYITQARMTYYRGEKAAPWLSLTLGNFSYKYNPDVKNFGMYLLRGPVYPGILMSGFQDFGVDTSKSNVLGARLHHAAGNFSHDLVLANEKDLPPTFDWSLTYVAKYKAFDVLEVGAGANFYRLIPYDSEMETPGHFVKQDNYVEVDTAGVGAGGAPDTVFFTHQGVKLVGMFSMDFKPLLGLKSMGPDDLKLYGEVAVLGLTDYGKTYDDIGERIPVMIGLNLPTFGILDHLSFEVEHYGSPYPNDLGNIGNLNNVADWMTLDRPVPSPKPVAGVYADSTKDNWKWSVNLEKRVKKHIFFLAQVANDHYRPRPVSTGLIFATGGTAEAFTRPDNYYFMFRMGYYF